MKCGIHRNNHSYQLKPLYLHKHAHIALKALVCAQPNGSEKDVDLTAKYHVTNPPFGLVAK